MKRSHFIIGSLLLLFNILFLSACEKTPTPEERLKEYIKLWNKQDFQTLYQDYVTSKAKKEFKKKGFVDRYHTIYQDLNVHDLQVKAEIKEEKDWKKSEKVELPIQVKMKTVAGEIQFRKKAVLKLEERDGKTNWYLDWNTTYIFPDLENGDKIRLKTVEGKRGEIFDQLGNSLAINSKGYEIGVIPEKFGEDPGRLALLSQQLGISTEFIKSQMNQAWVQPQYFVPLKTIPFENQTKLNQLLAIEGVQANSKEIREYPYHESAAHLVGYVGKVSGEELKKLKKKGYTEKDFVGKRGLEQLLEEQLHEEDGSQIMIEKVEGDTVVIAKKQPKDGKSVKLTINAELQKLIYDHMKGKPGSVAAVDPKTGNTMALVSSPAFDPNEFVHGIGESRYNQLEKDPNKPMLNRFAATYAPGSTMKTITASVGFQTGKLDPDKKRNIKGLKWNQVTRVSDIGKPVDLHDAMRYSDNIYFAQLANEIGGEDMVKGLKKFGFSEKFPYSYPIRASQVSNSGKLDKESLLLDSGYGQGEVLMSMLHLASIYGGVINDGTMMKPLLFAEDKPEVWKKDLITQKQADILKKDLRAVVEKGTAKIGNVPQLKLAGKTGTAELKLAQGSKGKENGLFAGYDQNNPNFVLAILFEGVQGQGGSNGAVELAKNVYLQWKSTPQI
ncbi:penicillin-binding protein [Oikeobacillus pervagus]|uniref:serine-type D-Ala-D-Ala carboxypeptidase n=1 Tax=Oikeobacillus pervagus TaxID=1325931 RepID=A0AAJ1WI72_9BACI|nr:penicillin-binding transpeptidase domain-containing protein [Oikeobacillus pervagus]MDQ0214098.1 penicillin-binding protein [Oikeobacillus pervagus]